MINVKKEYRQKSKTLIVANPYSGSGRNQQIVSKLKAALYQRGMEAHIMWDPYERTKLLQNSQRLASYRCVIAAGGDGTVADVVNETLDIPVVMMPIGSENLFARQFGYRRINEVADLVVYGHEHTIDLGRAGSRLFTLMVSAGFDGDVVHRVAKWRVNGSGLKRVNKLSYAWPIFNAVTSYDYPSVELEADGQVYRGVHALVFNIPQYACRLKFVNSAAQCDDGLLDWVVFEKPGLATMARYMTGLAVGGLHLRMADVHHGTAKKITLRSATGSPVPIQIDGDPAGYTPITTEIIPKRLRVIVPA